MTQVQKISIQTFQHSHKLGQDSPHIRHPCVRVEARRVEASDRDVCPEGLGPIDPKAIKLDLDRVVVFDAEGSSGTEPPCPEKRMAVLDVGGQRISLEYVYDGAERDAEH